MKRTIDRARAVVLVLGCWGAIASAATANLLPAVGPVSVATAASGAASLGAATFLGAQFLMPDSIRRWTRTRAVSEGIKQEIYRFRVHAAPYNCAGAAEVLRREVAAIEASAEDLLPYLSGADIGRTAPTALTPETYVRKRVEGQVRDYYLPRARRYTAQSRRLRRITLGLGMAATILSAMNTAAVTGENTSKLAPWVAVLTTIAGALAAHIANRRQDYLSISYTATAHRLNRLLAQWRTEGSPTDNPAWSSFVDAVESAIANENDAWLAKWCEEPTANG